MNKKLLYVVGGLGVLFFIASFMGLFALDIPLTDRCIDCVEIVKIEGDGDRDLYERTARYVGGEPGIDCVYSMPGYTEVVEYVEYPRNGVNWVYDFKGAYGISTAYTNEFPNGQTWIYNKPREHPSCVEELREEFGDIISEPEVPEEKGFFGRAWDSVRGFFVGGWVYLQLLFRGLIG